VGQVGKLLKNKILAKQFGKRLSRRQGVNDYTIAQVAGWSVPHNSTR